MRARRIVLIGVCTAVLLLVGCLHIRRKADLVSEFNLQRTVRIVVKLEDASAPLEITDQVEIGAILADLRRAETSRWLKYKEMGATTFVDRRGRELRFGLYGTTPGLIFRKDDRFFEFRGKLVDMILERYREN